MTRNECANKVLTYLKHQVYAVHTIRILNAVGLSDNTGTRQQLREVLFALAKSNVLIKYGTAKFKWKMKAAAWDPLNPFKVQGEEQEVYRPGLGRPHTSPTRARGSYSRGEPEEESGEESGLTKMVKEMASESDEDEKPKAVVDTEAYGLIHNLKLRLDSLVKGQAQMQAEVEAAKKEAEAAKQLAQQQKKTIVIERQYEAKTVTLKNVITPPYFQDILDLCRCRRNVLLVGPAGCGKTHVAELAARSLGLEFCSISCTAGMSESHLLGRAVPDLTHGKNRFQSTDFLRLYEGGGLFLLDELDAADPNLLLAINTAIANNYCNVPNRPDELRAKRHKDFVCVATANTFGRGATRQYAGRNQLDEATVDRFRIGFIECDYDQGVEAALCPGESPWTTPADQQANRLTEAVNRIVAKGYGLRGTCQYVRFKIEQAGLRRVMSTRFMIDAQVMHQHADWKLEKIFTTFFCGWAPDEIAKVSN